MEERSGLRTWVSRSRSRISGSSSRRRSSRRRRRRRRRRRSSSSSSSSSSRSRKRMRPARPTKGNRRSWRWEIRGATRPILATG